MNKFFGDSVNRSFLRWFVLMVFLFFGIFSGSLVLAEDRYVTEAQINLRSGPATSAGVVRVLKLGDKLEYIESNSFGWDRVRCQDGTEGWLARRGTSGTIPIEIERNQFNAEIKELKGKLVSQVKLQNELQRIQEASRNALRIERENQDLLAKVRLLEKSLKQASDENQILEKQSDTLFFLAGAGVLFLGFISGLLSRRRNKSSGYGSLN